MTWFKMVYFLSLSFTHLLTIKHVSLTLSHNHTITHSLSFFKWNVKLSVEITDKEM